MVRCLGGQCFGEHYGLRLLVRKSCSPVDFLLSFIFMASSNNEVNQEELSLDKYVAAVWRAKWLILAGVIAAAGITAFLSSREPAQHRAVAHLKIGRVWKQPIEDPYITERVINSGGFLKEAAAQIGVSQHQLKRSISAETIIAGPRRSRYPILLSLAATTDNRDDSIRYAQAAADALIARHADIFNEAIKPHLEQERRLEERRKELLAQPASRDLLIKIENELDEVRLNNSLADANVTEKTHLVDAISAESAVKPGFLRSTAAAALIAAVVLFAGAAMTVHIRAPGGPGSA
ncbi:MAG: hypothetical protein AABO41_03425 [Acidobacteriota bacterium]